MLGDSRKASNVLFVDSMEERSFIFRSYAREIALKVVPFMYTCLKIDYKNPVLYIHTLEQQFRASAAFPHPFVCFSPYSFPTCRPAAINRMGLMCICPGRVFTTERASRFLVLVKKQRLTARENHYS